MKDDKKNEIKKRVKQNRRDECSIYMQEKKK